MSSIFRRFNSPPTKAQLIAEGLCLLCPEIDYDSALNASEIALIHHEGESTDGRYLAGSIYQTALHILATDRAIEERVNEGGLN